MKRFSLALLAVLGACATTSGAPSPELFAADQVSTKASEWNATFSAAGELFFARSPEADFRAAKIMTAQRRGRGWTTPVPISFSGTATDTDPQIARDGRTLLFVSNRPPGAGSSGGGLDLWRSRRTGGDWTAPEPVPGVNSLGEELGPELHAGALFFNSTRRGGLGGLDIWTAAQAGEGFAAPTPLPAPVNSPASEGDFTLSPDGRVALFWSNRSGGLGQGDIYVSRRMADGWSEPVNLGPPVNSAAFDFTPSFSPDGRWLYFASMRSRSGADFRSDVYRIRVNSVPALRAALR